MGLRLAKPSLVPCQFAILDSPSFQPQSTPRNVYVFGLTSFLNDTASEMAYWVLPAFLASLGAGPAQLGIIEGIAESVASFAKFFSGYLADRVAHRKPIVVGGYFVANAVKPLLALVSSWWQILGIRFFDRFRQRRSWHRARRDGGRVGRQVSMLGSAYGLIQGMDSAGAIAGPLLALAVIGRFGMRGVFASAAIPGALCVIVVWLGFREVHRGGSDGFHARPSRDELAELTAASSDLRLVADGRGRPSLQANRWLPKLPAGFYYVLAVVTLFSLGNSSDMFLVLRAGSIGIPASRAPLAGTGLQYHVHARVLAGGQVQRPLLALGHRRRRIFRFRHRLFRLRARAFSTGDLADHGLLRTLLRADQSRAQGTGRRKRGRRTVADALWEFIRF
jgi:MFS family permease